MGCGAQDGKVLHGLFAAGVTGTGWGWRDDLERYRGTDGLTTDILDRFQAQGNGMPVTFRSTEEAFAAPGHRARSGRR